MDSSESWEPATVILKRSNYQIKTSSNVEAMVISEKYSKELLVKCFFTLKLKTNLTLFFLYICMLQCDKIADKSTVWILNTVCPDKL